MDKKLRIKFAIICIVVMLIAVLCSGCGCYKVTAGYVGIKVNLLGTSKGVDVEELGVGRYWLGINQELYRFPVYMQNYVWTKDKAEGSNNDESITFQSMEGLAFSGDFGISYHLDPLKVSGIFEMYRKGIEEITDVYLRNHFRDALNTVASTMNADHLYGEGKRELMDRALRMVQSQNDSVGIMIDKFYAIGKFRLPESVEKALNLKIEAIQRAQQRENEVQEARAEAEKLKAKAEGTKAKQALESSTLNDKILRKMWIEKWDGRLPNVLTGGSDAQLLLNLPDK